eukprot:TRINITY_DN32589_c0_g1_i1.p1 TRINITY_DN32589_c0_g1~~TRINITY_DN32589_c0_g1_i1.p1  ORF type:complete len:215 (+),score=21.53 TRINITY_DN32589_c0_g1_i1:92-646(+)
MGNGASELAVQRCSRHPERVGEGPAVAACRMLCADASEPQLPQLDQEAGPNRSISLGELCTFLRDPNMLTHDARPRHPSRVIPGGVGRFAEVGAESLVQVRHSEDAVLSASYKVTALTGKCVFTRAGLAHQSAARGLVPEPAANDQASTRKFCEQRCARTFWGSVPDVHFSLEELLERCRTRAV